MLEAISSTAISAGQAASRATETQAISPATTAITSTDDVGFDSVMKQVTTDAIGTLKAGESASISAMQGGKESTRKVVEALMSAEQALQTAVAVRDKVVQAYQEIARMSI